jgi:hypothetical protein
MVVKIQVATPVLSLIVAVNSTSNPNCCVRSMVVWY